MKRTVEDFREELNLIKTQPIKDWTEDTLKNTPEYFWIAKASSTGKYHPECTCKEGGLVTHVKRAIFFANRICEGWGIFDISRDIVLSATLLHDIAKVPNSKIAMNYGMKVTYEDYENHPINAKKYFSKKPIFEQDETNFTLNTIYDCIRYHMGRWTPESIKKDIADYSLVELAVYTADYIATTKTVKTEVDDK